ncbi:MAG: phosphoribosylamine--glycine ligase [bacterium]|nr:phosphoribosylamine--glycine ligase [bacterium]MDZ4284530.1 phosphoribosylamine--glycine ligase [Patescibacteria group bacterium]
MKILIVGSGAREHALAAKIAESPLVETLYAAPGNAGMEMVTLRSSGFSLEPVHIQASDINGLCSFAKCVSVDLTVVGPEIPLALGVVDRFLEWGLPIVGPTMAAARLEASKIFAKQLMWGLGIPTASGAVFCGDDVCLASVLGYAEEHFRRVKGPLVIKQDGLAGGKGVTIVRTPEEAEASIRAHLEEWRFGDGGRGLVLEKYLGGEELSFHVVARGEEFVVLPTAQDYKFLYASAEDGALGDNWMTGGMGAYAPVRITAALYKKIIDRIVRPTLAGMSARRTPFNGVLYIGLMIVEDEPYVLEFNVRFGDPEAQVILPLIPGDIVPLLLACASGRRFLTGEYRELASFVLPGGESSGYAVCVVLTSDGYAKEKKHGRHVIAGLDVVATLPHTRVYHASTVRGSDGGFQALDGNRVLSVVGEGDTHEDALERAYTAVEKIFWPGMYFRRDIGFLKKDSTWTKQR